MKAHEKKPTRYGKKFKIKKHDRVLITTGAFKGQIATVSRVDKETDRVLLAGVTPVVRHVKPNAMMPEGKMMRARSLHISNVSLFVEQDGKNVASKVRIEKTDGKRVRVLKKINEAVNEERTHG